MLKTRPQLLEFILNMLSNPWFSSIMSWEGMNGQFTIIRPEQAAHLWGDRNGRRNMTYQKFSRALRYYYHKKVLTKIRGQNYTYKFDFQQLERHYGYRGRSSVTFHQPTANSQYMIPSFAACNCDAFPVSHPTKRFFPQFSTTVWTCRKRIRQIELFSTVNRLLPQRALSRVFWIKFAFEPNERFLLELTLFSVLLTVPLMRMTDLLIMSRP